jgi:hypothetical protein
VDIFEGLYQPLLGHGLPQQFDDDIQVIDGIAFLDVLEKTPIGRLCDNPGLLRDHGQHFLDIVGFPENPGQGESHFAGPGQSQLIQTLPKTTGIDPF